MLPHYLWKVKVEICDKLHIRSTFKLIHCGVPRHLKSLASWTSSLLIRGEDQWRLLPWNAPLTAAVVLSVMREVLRKFLIFQQDSALACRACDTAWFLEHSTPALIPPDLWLPNSTDLDPVNYKIWGDVQQWMYQPQLHSDDDELKKRLLDVSHGRDQSVINDALIIAYWWVGSSIVYTGKRRTFRATVVCLTV